MGGCRTEFRGLENPNGMFLLDSCCAGREWLAGRMGGWKCCQGPSGVGSLISVFIGNEMNFFYPQVRRNFQIELREGSRLLGK